LFTVFGKSKLTTTLNSSKNTQKKEEKVGNQGFKNPKRKKGKWGVDKLSRNGMLLAVRRKFGGGLIHGS
jgi:hypothetical protein